MSKFYGIEEDIRKAYSEIEDDKNIDDLSREDYLDIILMYIVNRANAFDRKKYDCIAVPFLVDTKKYQLFYNCVKIISIYAQTKIYFYESQVSKIPWFDKRNTMLKKVNASKMAKKEKSGMVFSLALDDDIFEEKHPRIFKGVSEDMINEIVDTFFKMEEQDIKEEKGVN